MVIISTISAELVWKSVEQSKLENLEIVEAPDVADSHSLNVEMARKELKIREEVGTVSVHSPFL